MNLSLISLHLIVYFEKHVKLLKSNLVSYLKEGKKECRYAQEKLLIENQESLHQIKSSHNSTLNVIFKL